MKYLIRVNKIEIGFSLLNGFLGGAGTAAGFVFSLLGALTALLGLSGPLLLGVSIGALVLFSVLALSVGAYFFKKSLNAGKNLNKKLVDENEILRDTLIQHVILSPEKGFAPEEPPLEDAHSSKLTAIYASLAKKITQILKDEGLDKSEAIKDTNLTRYSERVKSVWNTDEELKGLYLNYQRELLSINSPPSLLAADSPTLLACINSFIDYGCSLGPSLGLIGILSGLGVVAGLSALAPPLLLSLLIAVTLVTIIGAYGVYYCESRNMRRNHLFAAMEDQIKSFTNPQKNIKMVVENPTVTLIDNNNEVFSSPLEARKDAIELLNFSSLSNNFSK